MRGNTINYYPPDHIDDVDLDGDYNDYHAHNGDDESTLVHYNDHPTHRAHHVTINYFGTYVSNVEYGPGFDPDDLPEDTA